VPLVYLGWQLTQKYGKTLPLFFLVVASLFFYGYWNPSLLAILLISLGANYTLGRLIIDGKSPSVLFYLGIAANLALLGYFKYAGFLVANIDNLFGVNTSFISPALPLGISFFTFQKIAFLSDTKAGKIKEISPLDYCLFVTFFPQLIAGPIVHHRAFIDQLDKSTERDKFADLAQGLSLFTFGLFKKAFLADKFAVFASPIFSDQLGSGINIYTAWIGALSYTLQLYFDFSGYSDMALGLARIFGISLPINFNSPYKANSIIEFWRRWHITLSVFLRDYIYIPLGGSQVGSGRRYLNIFATMIIGGIWHGAGWCFFIWGFYHAIGITINHLFRDFISESIGSKLNKMIRIVALPATFIFVTAGWVVFRSASVQGAGIHLLHMFNVYNPTMPTPWQSKLDWLMPHANYSGAASSAPIGWLIAGLILVFLTPNTNQIFATSPEIGTSRFKWQPSWQWLLLTMALFIASISAMTSVSEFLYFQF
jgi:D-alanyl-lipoteichoic acid acyltransferase DltB (MBOAT superfamily)